MLRSRAVNKITPFCLVFFALAAVLATPSAATVIRSVDGSGNVTAPGAPGDNPGWDNVGALGNAGAVYLGNRWVLTAAHVWNESLTAVNFAGAFYGIEAGSWTGLHAPGDPGTKADLGLLRITGTPPGLADLHISHSAPIASEVVGIGFGQDRAASGTSWDSGWNEVFPPGTYNGFKLEATRAKRWGKNDVDGTEQIDTGGPGGPYKTDALAMDFDQFGGAGDDEMQAVLGDSGGGLFYKGLDGWELAGIFVARWSPFPGQPSNTAVYDNLSFAADLSQYRGQIPVIPEPAALVMLLGLGAGCLAWSVWRRASR